MRMLVPDRFLGLRIRILSGVQMSVSFGCYVSSGTGLCDGPIPRQEESYRVRLVFMYDLET
jgi:hypothetical protein